MTSNFYFMYLMTFGHLDIWTFGHGDVRSKKKYKFSNHFFSFMHNRMAASFNLNGDLLIHIGSFCSRMECIIIGKLLCKSPSHLNIMLDSIQEMIVPKDFKR